MKKQITAAILMLAMIVMSGCEARQTFVEEPETTQTPYIVRQIKLIDEGPAEGGTLTLFTAPVDTVHPYQTLNRYVSHISFFVYESLFVQSDENSVEPWLISNWENQDFLNWSFTLKEDVFFHHGYELSAYDVRYTFEVLERSDSPFYHTEIFENIAEILIHSATQFEIRLQVPDKSFIHKLIFPILSCTIESRENDFIAGTGPYQFDRLDESTVTLVRNEQWWHHPLPYFDSVVFKVYPENEIMDAFQNNEIDIAFIKNVDFSKFNYRTDIHFQVYPEDKGNFLYVNPDSLFGRENRQENLFRYITSRIHELNVGQVQYFEDQGDEVMDIEEFREAMMQSGLVWNRDRKVYTEYGRTLKKVSILVPKQELQKLHTANFLVNILEDAGIQAEIISYNQGDIKKILQNGRYDLYPVTEEIRPWESLEDTLRRMQNELGYGRNDSHILPLYRNQQAILFKKHIRGEKNSIYWNPYQGFYAWYNSVYREEPVH